MGESTTREYDNKMDLTDNELMKTYEAYLIKIAGQGEFSICSTRTLPGLLSGRVTLSINLRRFQRKIAADAVQRSSGASRLFQDDHR